VGRARAGVKVFFLYDAFGSSFPKEYIKSLQDAGIRTAPFRPLTLFTAQKMQNRAHIRVVCVDGRFAGVWRHERKGATVVVEVEPFAARVPRALRAGVEQEAQGLAAFLGATPDLRWI
jgi:phosphatidylserine/phosphatidylglycerophosphate/cardiolipin synthase-like enzyme